MARRIRAPCRPRLHADVDPRGSRRAARSGHDRGRREAGITVFDTARAYGDNESLVARGLRHANTVDTARIVTKGGMKRDGRQVDPRRPREGDPRRLRSKPHRAARTRDRPLLHPCAGSGDALEDVGARAGAARRRGLRETCGRRERRSAAAGGGARACSRRRCPGRAQRLRRQRSPGRSRRTLRRGGHHADRALAARRATPVGPPCPSRNWPKQRSPGCSSSPPLSSQSPVLAVRRRPARRPGQRGSALARATGQPSASPDLSDARARQATVTSSS